MAHATREPVPVTARRPDVPAALGEIIARCLRKDPAERWSSAEALCQALRGLSGAVATVTPNPDRIEGDGGALEDLEAARAALARGRWREAYLRFTAASAAGPLEAEDLERLAEVAWWVAQGSSAKSWNTSARSGPGPWTSLPFTNTSPVLRGMRPEMILSSVVLPQPLGPSRVVSWPCGNPMLTSFSASTPLS